MSQFPAFRNQLVDTGPLLPLVADFSGVHSLAEDTLKAAKWKICYELVDEFKVL